MLKNEAAWLGRELGAIPVASLSPLLSIGSGSAAGRARQPWIDEHVFGPLQHRGVSVLHHEHRMAPGVDVAGDLADPAFLERLASLGASSVLCANVLEHLEAPGVLAGALARAVAPGGYVVVTVPRAYPYHPDPIDTMLRPSVQELAGMLPGLDLVRGDEVPCGSLLSYAWSVRGKRAMVVNGLRAALRRDRAPTGTRPARPAGRAASATSYVLAPTAVTCAVFVRSGAQDGGGG